MRTTVVTTQAPMAVPSEQPLTAIFIKGSERFAVIDGDVYRKGDSYQDGRIVRILSGKVEWRSASGLKQLTLIPSIKK